MSFIALSFRLRQTRILRPGNGWTVARWTQIAMPTTGWLRLILATDP